MILEKLRILAWIWIDLSALLCASVLVMAVRDAGLIDMYCSYSALFLMVVVLGIMFRRSSLWRRLIGSAICGGFLILMGHEHLRTGAWSFWTVWIVVGSVVTAISLWSRFDPARGMASA